MASLKLTELTAAQGTIRTGSVFILKKS